MRHAKPRLLLDLGLRIGLSLLFGACNRVAVLEGDLRVIGSDDRELFVVPQAAPASLPFDDAWTGFDLVPQSLSSDGVSYQFSLSTPSPDQDVHLRVRWCRNDTCTFLPASGEDRADPQAELRIVVEQPFFLDRRDPSPSYLQLELDPLSCVSDACEPCRGCSDCRLVEPEVWVCEVDRCGVAGCVDAPGVVGTNYCEPNGEGELVHFCDL
jgi:hypothetical protein